MTGLPALMAAAGRRVADDERLAVAVSGGPDSIGLLAAAHAAYPGRIVALTVDHGLRAASSQEAASVAAQCAARGIPHFTLLWQGEKPVSDIQASARAARYRLLLGWCRANAVPLLLTAHHLDDQAETLLIRLARGSGSAGLAGVRALRRAGGIDIVRPMLGTCRAVLARWAAGWTVVADPANTDPRYARTNVRALLGCEAALLPAVGLAASAAHLAAAEEALVWAVDQAWAGRTRTHDDGLWVDAAGLPDELRRRLLVRALASIMPDCTPRGPALVRLVARLDSGATATLSGVRVRPETGLKQGWHFTKARLRRNRAANQGQNDR